MKIFQCWHFTPVKLVHIFSTQPRECWRKCSMDGHIFHIWWECPVITQFWRDISSLNKELAKVSNELSLQMALFGLDLSSLPSKFLPVVTHVLSSAHLAIAHLCKHASPPTLGMTINILNDHISMELLFDKTL